MNSAQFHKLIDADNFEFSPECLTRELLISYDRHGKSAVCKLAVAGKFSMVPEHFISNELLFLPSSSILAEPEDVEEETWTPLDGIIINKQFMLLPPMFRTAETLLRPQTGGWTGLHVAASFGVLQQFPAEFLTEENLCIPKNNGQNCFHLSALNGYLAQIPSTSISTPALLLEDSDNLTPLHYALECADTPLFTMPVDEQCRPILGGVLDIILATQAACRGLQVESLESEVDLF